MKKFGKQSKEITLKRINSDNFTFTIETGEYYIDGKETGVFINVEGCIVFFETFDEYWKTNLDKPFWEELLWHTNHDEITDAEATALGYVVEELRKETNTGINQLYIDDETWIDGLFDIVVSE